MNVREILKNGMVQLKEYQIEDSVLKMKMLLAYELNIPYEQLVLYEEKEIKAEFVTKIESKIEELAKGKPIQYITNLQSFYGLDFYVDENVLIPQPDTEIVVEKVIKLAVDQGKKLKILDICTGSGAIAISIGKNIEADIVASDVSKSALEIARKNAFYHNVEIEFVESDMFEKITGKFDIIVSNPPYIETETIQSLSDEVKNEPILALDGGEDGLDFYRILTKEAGKYLVSDGSLVVEIGYNQSENVMKLFEKQGFCEVCVQKDFGGNDRMMIGKWR